MKDERDDYHFLRRFELASLNDVYVNFRQKPPSNLTSIINPPTLMSKQLRDYFRRLWPTWFDFSVKERRISKAGDYLNPWTYRARRRSFLPINVTVLFSRTNCLCGWT